MLTFLACAQRDRGSTHLTVSHTTLLLRYWHDESRWLSAHTFLLLGSWMGQETSGCVCDVNCHWRKWLPTPVTLSVDGYVRAVSWWREIALLLLPNSLLVPIHLKLKFQTHISWWLVSTKTTSCWALRHPTTRTITITVERDWEIICGGCLLLSSEVNGSAFVPRYTVIMAQCTDFLSSDSVLLASRESCAYHCSV